MNSRHSLSGKELFQLYLENQENDHLNDPYNLRLLLNYALDNMEEMMDSNLEFDIVDYCVKRLQEKEKEKEKEVLDEEKIQYYRDKYNIVEKQMELKRRHRRYASMAATAAMFVVIVGVLLFQGGTEGKAGVFELFGNFFTSSDGEQLVLESSNMILDEVEVKEGHLPDALPDEFVFDKHDINTSSLSNIYVYRFMDENETPLFIQIKEYLNSETPTTNELEINNYSYKKESNRNCTYYYSTNKSQNVISWIYNNRIYTLRGEYDYSKLEEILSLYEEEQIQK